MERSCIIETLRAILAECLHGEVPELDPDSVLTADLGLNSMELFDLVCSIEERFAIEIPDRILPRLLTVRDVVEFLEEAGGGG